MGAVENPFVFGEIVEQDKFVDRQEEIRRLVRSCQTGRRSFFCLRAGSARALWWRLPS